MFRIQFLKFKSFYGAKIKVVNFFQLLICVQGYFFSLSAVSQINNIYNGNFELHFGCPDGMSVNNPGQLYKCTGWSMPTPGTSDFFHVCNNSLNGQVGIPSNFAGYQSSFNGDGYLGIHMGTFHTGNGIGGYWGSTYREYVQGYLPNNLIPGQVYKLSMEISLSQISGSKVNEFGAYLSTNAITGATTKNLNVTPQCLFYNQSFFGDTSNWMHVESYFIADGTENYITIGNFNDSLNTDTLSTGFMLSSGNPTDKKLSYYYLDNVQLVEASFLPPDYSELAISIEEVLVPNIFSPNGDGKNDLWFVYSGKIQQNHQISILNRWGEIIKQGEINGFTWDGKTSFGENCSEGIYFFCITGTNKHGIIQLIR